MQLSAFIVRAEATPKGLEVTATVSLEPDPAGGFRISNIALVVRGEVEGLDDAGFKEVAENAKAQCPVSKALTGTTITLDASLA
jgi:osmotically inducible protein OsmC